MFDHISKVTLLRATDLKSYSLEGIFYALGKIPADDVPNAATLIRRCLTLDPAAPPSALELLNNKWLEGQ